MELNLVIGVLLVLCLFFVLELISSQRELKFLRAKSRAMESDYKALADSITGIDIEHSKEILHLQQELEFANIRTSKAERGLSMLKNGLAALIAKPLDINKVE